MGLEGKKSVSTESLVLTAQSIDREIAKYSDAVQDIVLPTPTDDVVETLTILKRRPLGSGPYPNVSVYEAGNKILSDLVVFEGVKKLLKGLADHSIELPFAEYTIRLRTSPGFSVTASCGEIRLIGAACNVAKSFFGTRRRTQEQRLSRDQEANYRVLLFNADATPDPSNYIGISTAELIYVLLRFSCDHTQRRLKAATIRAKLTGATPAIQSQWT
ncbi:MAG TPA: hypothetical protein QF520_00270 [SAR202 cluster bacterium]|nr:hypothetical protein [SAR202 cluster bacterium]